MTEENRAPEQAKQSAAKGAAGRPAGSRGTGTAGRPAGNTAKGTADAAGRTAGNATKNASGKERPAGKQAPHGKPSGGQPEAAAEPVTEASAGPKETPETAAETGPAAGGAKEELAALKDQHLRLLAEYDNYRKRTAREKEALWLDAKCDTIQKFLPVYDNLERAASAAGDEENPHKKGLVMILQQYRELLKSLGVTEIEALGKPFDPERHNAVMHVENPDFGENTVSQVFQAGFRLGDKVIRHATVQVAN